MNDDDPSRGPDSDEEPLPLDDGSPELAELLDADGAAGILPLRGAVVFPGTVASIEIGRPKSAALVHAVLSDKRVLVAVKQKQIGTDEPSLDDLEPVGCMAMILRMAPSPDGALNLLVHGIRRVNLVELVASDPFPRARVEEVETTEPEGAEAEALVLTARDQIRRLQALTPEAPNALLHIAKQIEIPGELADLVASLLELEADEAQALLAETDGGKRLHTVIERAERQLHALTLGMEIREAAQKSITQQHTEAVLREQLEAIQQRLGEGDEAEEAAKALEAKLGSIDLPEDARKEVDRQLGRLRRTPTQSAEYSVIRTYLEWMSELPWDTSSKDQLDLDRAKRILDEDHHGLTKIKDRIIEFLAVRRFKPEAPSPIICFVGPPGTGKTSLGRSIARALGREYVRQSLGGIHDEAEIRGHRRTYVGALPGRLIAAMRKAGTNNPVIVLDEIDKVGRDARGDPYAALLEVLDPEQNATFTDHYLATPFDLSKVMFICTANMIETIPGPLRDRMEVVHLPGYTPQEKQVIAKQYIVPHKLAEYGLDAEGLTLTDDAIELLVGGYTKEAGVRELERQVATTLRKSARALATEADPPRRIDAARVRELLGHPRYLEPELPSLDRPGTALGLAWTPVGGEVLVVEAVAAKGKEGLVLTGQLGDVMKESATAALSYLRANPDQVGGDAACVDDSRIHLHVPAGAIPKDGPSAGVAMFIALASLCSGRLPVPHVAMTGEITLLGRVLPVGGIKEKVLGAHRAGIETVILPRRNEQDLDDVPDDVRSAVRFVLIDDASEAVEVALQPAQTDSAQAVG